MSHMSNSESRNSSYAHRNFGLMGHGSQILDFISEFHTLTDLYTKFQLSWYYGSQKLGHRLAEPPFKFKESSLLESYKFGTIFHKNCN
jgi:hypothetical protein